MELLCKYNAKYLGRTDYNLNRATLSEAVYSFYLSLATSGNDISTTTEPCSWINITRCHNHTHC